MSKLIKLKNRKKFVRIRQKKLFHKIIRYHINTEIFFWQINREDKSKMLVKMLLIVLFIKKIAINIII